MYVTKAGERDRSGRYFEVFGLSYPQVLALVAAVARWQVEREPVTRLDVKELVFRVDGLASAGEHLHELCRLRLVEECGKRQQRLYYKPTARGIRMVLGWVGERERAA